MLLAIGLALLGLLYKNNEIIKIKSFDQTKSLGEMTKLIKNKRNKKSKKDAKKSLISRLVIVDNDSNDIISFIKDKSNPTHILTTKTNSNERMNMYLMDTLIKYKINYCVGRKITHNLFDTIGNDISFIINKIVMPYLYLVIIFSAINIMGQLSTSLDTTNDYMNDISQFGLGSNSGIEIKELNITNSSSTDIVSKIQIPPNFDVPNVSLSKWVGSPEVFEECYEIISYQTNNSHYKKLGAVLPGGILLEGPPGVGKTYLAKAIASETQSSFYSMSGSEFIEMYVGVGASRVRNLFSKARTNAPSIIFIDEIDAIGGKRSGGGSGGSHREHDQTLNQLLTEMDGFKDNGQIIVMAATNRKDMLDPALLRPGRFDRHIHISLPDRYSREQILQLYLGEKKRKEKSINTTMIAELTDGFSGADLKNLINEAAILAARRGGQRIKSTDLTNAMEKLVVGLVRNRDDRTEEARYRVGIHEVGHGFLTIYFDKYFDLQKISIKSTYDGAGGYTLLNEKIEYSSAGLYTKDLLFKKIVILLGGKAAEAIWYGREQVSLGATQDLKQANQLARKMIELFGMGTDDLETFYNTENAYGSSNSEKIKELVDNQIISIVSKAYSEAKQILEKYKWVCNEIADKLIKDEILYRKDLETYYDIKF
jgi:cell division protease FtsH